MAIFRGFRGQTAQKIWLRLNYSDGDSIGNRKYLQSANKINDLDIINSNKKLCSYQNKGSVPEIGFILVAMLIYSQYIKILSKRFLENACCFPKITSKGCLSSLLRLIDLALLLKLELPVRRTKTRDSKTNLIVF